MAKKRNDFKITKDCDPLIILLRDMLLAIANGKEVTIEQDNGEEKVFFAADALTMHSSAQSLRFFGHTPEEIFQMTGFVYEEIEEEKD